MAKKAAKRIKRLERQIEKLTRTINEYMYGSDPDDGPPAPLLPEREIEPDLLMYR